METTVRNGLLATILAILVFSSIATAQIDSSPRIRLRSPAVVRGFIGGESHDSYVIRAVEGQTMIVQITWRREGKNGAGFEITDTPTYFDTESVSFGNTSDDGKRWTGVIPKTGDYYIHVVAYPTAHYKLTVVIDSSKNKSFRRSRTKRN